MRAPAPESSAPSVTVPDGMAEALEPTASLCASEMGRALQMPLPYTPSDEAREE